MQLREYQAAFNQKHPEAGDINAGVRVSSEQLQQFSEIIGAKVEQLSQKPQLTTTEAAFIDRTMDLGTRSVIYVHERLGIAIPESESTITVAAGIGQLQGAAPAPQDIVAGLHSITGSSYSVRTAPESRDPIGEIGRGSVQMLAEMADSTDGVVVDNYLEGNLQNIIAHYEQVSNQ